MKNTDHYTSEELRAAYESLCAMYGDLEWSENEVKTQARYFRES